MNYMRLAMAVVAAFLVVFVLDFVVHGVLLMDLYAETAHLWRPQEEMMSFMPLATGMQFGFAVLLSVAYVLLVSDDGWRAGLKFGVIFGAVFGFMQLSIYPYMPIPLALAGAWFLGEFVKAALVGVVIGAIYKR